MEEKKITSISSFLSRINDVESQLRESIRHYVHTSDLPEWEENDIDKGKFYYRGQSDSSWKLVPSIFRDRWVVNPRFAYNSILTNIQVHNRSYLEQEKEILREVERRYSECFSNCKSTLDKLVVLQHYGIPTRLLDVTSNALVALYNAVGTPKREDGANFNKNLTYEKDGRVFIFFVPLHELKSAYGGQQKNLSYADIDYSYATHITRGRGAVMRKLTPQFVCPNYLTARQWSQQGAFYLVPSKGKYVLNHIKMCAYAHPSPATFEKWKYSVLNVPRNAKEKIHNELAEHCGICDHILYPESPDGYKQDLLDELDSRIFEFKL